MSNVRPDPGHDLWMSNVRPDPGHDQCANELARKDFADVDIQVEASGMFMHNLMRFSFAQ
jgi:hypothetical protein